MQTISQLRTDFRGFIDIWRRVHIQKQNAIVLVWGDTGIGKSWFSLWLACILDPTFAENLKERVIFHPKEFLINLKRNVYKRGNVVILEEVGTSVGAREWYSRINRAIMKVLQTFRNKRLIVIMTVPSPSFVDTQSRKLTNFDACVVKRRERDYTLFFHKILGTTRFDEPLLLTYRDNMGVKLNPIIVHGLPVCKLTKLYESFAMPYKNEVIAEAFDTLQEVEQKTKSSVHIDVNMKETAEKLIKEHSIGLRGPRRLTVSIPQIKNFTKFSDGQCRSIKEMIVDLLLTKNNEKGSVV